MACAFIGDAPNILAVAGWDGDGNGVLLISEFAAHQEARRIAYHVLVKNGLEETEEERRRRRARGWKPRVPDTPDHAEFGNFQISEPGMNHLSTHDVEDDDFCEVLMVERSTGPITIDSMGPAGTGTDATTTSGKSKNKEEQEGEEKEEEANEEDPADFQDTIQTASTVPLS